MISEAGGPGTRDSYYPSPGQDAKHRAPDACSPSSASSLVRDDTSQRGWQEQDTIPLHMLPCGDTMQHGESSGNASGKPSLVEKELEVEASKRQLSQLEKDKLEMMVQEETREREADVAELRQLIKGHTTMLITELAQRKGDGGGGASAAMQIDLQELRSELFAIKDDLRGTKDEWHNKVQSLSSQLDSLMSSLTDMRTRQAGMLARLGSIEPKLEQQASLSRGLEALESKLAATSAVEEDMKEARNSLSVLAARADQSEGTMQKFMADATSLASRCKALEEVPAAEEKWQVMFEEEKFRRETGLAELRRLLDSQLAQSMPAGIQQSQQRTAGGASSVEVTLGQEQSQALNLLVHDMQEMRSQLVALKEETQGAKAESRLSKATSAELESLVHTLENDANRQAKLLEGLTRLRPRLETVEDKIQQQSVAVAQTRASDEEAKSSKEAIASVASRTDQLEQSLRRSGLDVTGSSSSSFADKLKFIEGEVASLSRSGIPLMKEVKALLQDYLAGVVVEAKTKDGAASANSVTNSTVERQNSSRTSVAQSSSLTPRGTEADGNDEVSASVLSAELKDLKLLLQPIQAAAAESRGPAPNVHPARQMSGGSLSSGGGAGSSSVDWWDTSAAEGLKPTVFRELKESMASLVSRVNDTLIRDTATSAPSSQAEVGPPASAATSQQDQTRFLKALQAVRDLRELNTDLRVRNAQLAERLSHDVAGATGPVTPSAAATERAGFGQEQLGKSPTSPRLAGNLLNSSSHAASGSTTPQHGVQRTTSLGQPASSLGGRTFGAGPPPGSRPVSLQASSLRPPGSGRLGMGPSPTPQLRSTSGLAAAAGAQGSKPTTPSSQLASKPTTPSSQLASGGFRPSGSRVLPLTSRAGPLSR